jgi:broad specificity phosphatase PhoE
LFIVRHGEKESDEFNSNLTNFGIEQANKIADLLKTKNFKRLYSSSNPRSIQTGEIISNKSSIPLEVIDCIKELPKNIFFQLESDWDGENKRIVDNIKSFLEDLKRKDEDSVLSLNAGLNRVILSLILDIPLHKSVQFTQNVACLNLLEYKEIYGKKRWCVVLLNDTCHLQ